MNVDEKPIVEHHHHGLRRAGPRIERLGMKARIVASRRRADSQRHLDALAAIIVAATRDRPDVARVATKIARQHLGVPLRTRRTRARPLWP